MSKPKFTDKSGKIKPYKEVRKMLDDTVSRYFTEAQKSDLIIQPDMVILKKTQSVGKTENIDTSLVKDVKFLPTPKETVTQFKKRTTTS